MAKDRIVLREVKNRNEIAIIVESTERDGSVKENIVCYVKDMDYLESIEHIVHEDMNIQLSGKERKWFYVDAVGNLYNHDGSLAASVYDPEE